MLILSLSYHFLLFMRASIYHIKSLGHFIEFLNFFITFIMVIFFIMVSKQRWRKLCSSHYIPGIQTQPLWCYRHLQYRQTLKYEVIFVTKPFSSVPQFRFWLWSSPRWTGSRQSTMRSAVLLHLETNSRSLGESREYLIERLKDIWHKSVNWRKCRIVYAII